jgi:phage repressor protein C with HTH and peptisase S24 domain
MSTPMYQKNAEYVQNSRESILLKDSIAFRDRLRKVVNFFNTNTEAAGHIGVSEKTIRRWLSGDAEPRRPALAKLASVAGVSYDWLVNDSGEMLMADAQKKSNVTRGGHVRELSEPTAFSPELTSLLQGSRNLHLYEQRNMEPTIHMGEIVIIDTQKTLDISTVINGVYLVEMGDLREIRRVQRLPNGHINLTNDNSTYAQSNTSIDLLHPGFQVSIIGRIYRGGQPL